jgi:hypothetical protein
MGRCFDNPPVSAAPVNRPRHKATSFPPWIATRVEAEQAAEARQQLGADFVRASQACTQQANRHKFYKDPDFKAVANADGTRCVCSVRPKIGSTSRPAWSSRGIAWIPSNRLLPPKQQDLGSASARTWCTWRAASEVAGTGAATLRCCVRRLVSRAPRRSRTSSRRTRLELPPRADRSADAPVGRRRGQ